MKKIICLAVIAILSFSTALFVGCDNRKEENEHKLTQGTEDNICDHCNEKLFTGEITFTLSENQKYYIIDGCKDLEGEVKIPAYYKSRGDDKYLPVMEITKNLSSASVLEIPSTVEEIKSITGGNVTEYRVSKANKFFKSENGILYNKNGNKLIAYPKKATATEFTIPDSVDELGKSAFSGASLEKIKFTANSPIKELPNSVFAGVNFKSIELHEGLEKIGKGAFRSCPNADIIAIPDSVTEIGDEAFSWSNVKAVTFGENSKLTSLGNDAFYYCSALEEITLPKQLNKIEYETFYWCENLKTVNIGEGVTFIDALAFFGCSKLTTLNIPINSKLTKIVGRAFVGCVSLTEIYIPKGVTELFETFMGCSALKKVIFAEDSQLKVIGQTTFENCSSLEEITIPKTVEEIGYQAFHSCSKLKSIVIPKSVKTMGFYVFSRNEQEYIEKITVYVEYEKDEIPEGWNFQWSSSVHGDVSIIYGYTGN